MEKMRPPKKKLEKFEETFEDVPTPKELKEDESKFKKQLGRLKSMFGHKKVGEKVLKEAEK